MLSNTHAAAQEGSAVRVGVIGGTGFSEGLSELSQGAGHDRPVKTRFGSVTARFLPLAEGGEIVFVPRHGFKHAVPPHRVDHWAHITALKDCGVKYVLSTSAVGSLRASIETGDLIILSDFIDLRGGPPTTFFEGDNGVRHTDFTEPFCPELRSILLEEAGRRAAPALKVHSEGIYLCLAGPRYETPAEVRLFASWGADVVGMTVAPEAILAREAGLCYASVSVATNLACGLSATQLSHREVETQMAVSRPFMIALLHRTASRLAAAQLAKS
jgi:5'-methylthioadenosine phosphorylase